MQKFLSKPYLKLFFIYLLPVVLAVQLKSPFLTKTSKQVITRLVGDLSLILEKNLKIIQSARKVTICIPGVRNKIYLEILFWKYLVDFSDFATSIPGSYLLPKTLKLIQLYFLQVEKVSRVLRWTRKLYKFSAVRYIYSRYFQDMGLGRWSFRTFLLYFLHFSVVSNISDALLLDTKTSPSSINFKFISALTQEFWIK